MRFVVLERLEKKSEKEVDSEGNCGILRVKGESMKPRSYYENLSDAELAGARRDLFETIEIQEKSVRNGGHCPKLGTYYDELAVVAEIQRKRTGGNHCPTCGRRRK
jgi:hypothetical protein